MVSVRENAPNPHEAPGSLEVCWDGVWEGRDILMETGAKEEVWNGEQRVGTGHADLCWALKCVTFVGL